MNSDEVNCRLTDPSAMCATYPSALAEVKVICLAIARLANEIKNAGSSVGA